ncbi:unnamed protein product [Meloidogyne enterolobii]|uniref:Uncharacterized protein n=1 Tax=Meloidogyne enterolobii TaxID=390850 RepID=A0ACB0YTY8_MELEN
MLNWLEGVGPMDLSAYAEEVATFYAKMLDHDYTSKPIFNQNFFKDWRKVFSFKKFSKN